MKFIWQQRGWPCLEWDARAVAPVLSDVVFKEGRFLGELSVIGFENRARAGFEALSAEIVNSAAIEGESLNLEDVRSSVARRMEIVLCERPTSVSHVLDSRVEMMMDATRNWTKPLSVNRLKTWHAALFPTGYSGLTRIAAGRIRNDSEGPMQVVSRHGMLMRVHFEAPPAMCLGTELKSFVSWLNGKDADTPPFVRVALAHLRFLTLHPFEDGNGRLARALTDYLLARYERQGLRFYSLSTQIQKEKSDYYGELEHAQRNTLDVTRWVKWFLALQGRAIDASAEMLAGILAKAHFWQRHGQDDFSAHQREILNRLLDGFSGNLTTSKWAKICKVSQDTAMREIAGLMKMDILRQEGGGRSTHYVLTDPVRSATPLSEGTGK